jgi:hypothetical protein
VARPYQIYSNAHEKRKKPTSPHLGSNEHQTKHIPELHLKTQTFFHAFHLLVPATLQAQDSRDRDIGLPKPHQFTAGPHLQWRARRTGTRAAAAALPPLSGDPSRRGNPDRQLLPRPCSSRACSASSPSPIPPWRAPSRRQPKPAQRSGSSDRSLTGSAAAPFSTRYPGAERIGAGRLPWPGESEAVVAGGVGTKRGFASAAQVAELGTRGPASSGPTRRLPAWLGTTRRPGCQ